MFPGQKNRGVCVRWGRTLTHPQYFPSGIRWPLPDLGGSHHMEADTFHFLDIDHLVNHRLLLTKEMGFQLTMNEVVPNTRATTLLRSWIT